MEEIESEFTGIVQWFHNSDGLEAAVGESQGEVCVIVQFAERPWPEHIRVRVFEIVGPPRRLPASWQGESVVNRTGMARLTLPPNWLTLLASKLSMVVEEFPAHQTNSATEFGEEE